MYHCLSHKHPDHFHQVPQSEKEDQWLSNYKKNRLLKMEINKAKYQNTRLHNLFHYRNKDSFKFPFNRS